MTISKKIPQNMATLGNFFQKSYFAQSQAPLFLDPGVGKKIITPKNDGILKPTIIIGSLYSPKIIKYFKK